MRKSNVIKDFVAVAGPLGISHMLMLTKTEEHTNLVSKKLDPFVNYTQFFGHLTCRKARNEVNLPTSVPP